MTFNELIDQINNMLANFATEVGNDVTSDNKDDTTDFSKATGYYVNTPILPWTSSTIPLVGSGAVKGGIVSIWYKGAVLSKSDFTGGTVVMFSGENTLNTLCRVFIDFDKNNNAYSVNIQTGFTGDLPTNTKPSTLTITGAEEVSNDAPDTLTITGAETT